MQRSAHAYGRESLEALRTAVERSRTAKGVHDPLAPVTIVVPSTLSGYHIRRFLGRQPGGIVNVQVRTLQALLELIGSGSLANQGRRPLGEAFRHEAIRAVAEDDSSGFGDLPIEDAMLNTLEQRFAEFDECDDDGLDGIAASGPMPGYLVARYRAYLQRTAGFYTNRDLADAAATALERGPSVLNDLGSLIIYLPDEWTTAEQRVLDVLARSQDVRILVGLTGEADPVDDRALRRWEMPADTTRSELPFAQQIVQSPDAEEEVRSAIREMLESLQSDEPTPLHRTAILYRHAEPYARICAEQLDSAEIPWNGRNARTLGQSIAGRVLAGILDLIRGPHPVWATDVAPWLAAAPIRDVNGILAPAARWNQLARGANLQRGPEDWQARLERYRTTRADDLERLLRDADDDRPGRTPWLRAEIALIDDLSAFATQLANWLNDASSDGSWSDSVERTRRLLRALLGDRNVFAQSLQADEGDQELARWDDIEALLQSVRSLDELGPATPARFASAVARGLERRVGHHGRLGDGVYVGSLRSAVGMNWDQIYILGAAERAMPPARAEDPLLPDRQRARMSLPLSSDQLRRERADFLAALHSAERCTISYPRANVRSQQGSLPSRWLLESATHLQGGERVYASKINDVGRDIIAAAASFEQAVTGAVHHADLSEFDLATLRNAPDPLHHELTRRSAALARGVEQRLQRTTRALTRWNGLIADGAERAAAQHHSAGALQDWATCPYRYFLGRVLRIEEREEPRDDLQIVPRDKGTLIHDILEQFYNETPSQPDPEEAWPAAQQDRLIAIAEQLMERLEAQGLTGRDLLWQRDSRRIINDLRTYLEADDVHRALRKVRQIDGELTFGRLEGSAGPVNLQLQDGSTLQLRGRIDRVDRSDAGDLLMVIDYKSGVERPKSSELEDDPVVRGQYLQLPVYAVAARQLFEAANQDVVRSAYWHVTDRGGFAFNEVTWTGEKWERFESVLELILANVRQGHFPANPGPSHRSARGEHCAYCSFDEICPADRRRQWERIRLDPLLSDYVELSEHDQQKASTR